MFRLLRDIASWGITVESARRSTESWMATLVRLLGKVREFGLRENHRMGKSNVNHTN